MEPGVLQDLLPVADPLLKTIHLAAMAVGFGTMVATDFLSMRHLRNPVTRSYRRALRQAHAVMFPALIIAWITGISLIWARTGFVAEAHALGLAVHPWTFRDDQPADIDPEAELRRIYALGVDGIFTDFPATAIRVRDDM